MKNTSIINRAAVKRLALDMARKRAHKFTRVSEEFLNTTEAQLRLNISRRIESHPSKGKTLK